MELHQLNSTLNEDAVIELLTLTCEIDKYGNKIYRNKEGQLHRIHGPAYISTELELWYKNGKNHREDGPAAIYAYGKEFYIINNEKLTKKQFIQWQKKNGIKPIE